MEVRSVGNSQALRDTALVEAFNLKAAIEYTMKPPNLEAAKEALMDMPPRSEEELDPVLRQLHLNVPTIIHGVCMIPQNRCLQGCSCTPIS
jgi:hypothetical protein